MELWKRETEHTHVEKTPSQDRKTKHIFESLINSIRWCVLKGIPGNAGPQRSLQSEEQIFNHNKSHVNPLIEPLIKVSTVVGLPNNETDWPERVDGTTSIQD